MTKKQYIQQYFKYMATASEYQKELLKKVTVEQTAKDGSTFGAVTELIESGYFSWLR